MHLFATSSPEQFLERGRIAVIEVEKKPRDQTVGPAWGARALTWPAKLSDHIPTQVDTRGMWLIDVTAAREVQAGARMAVARRQRMGPTSHSGAIVSAEMVCAPPIAGHRPCLPVRSEVG